MTAAQMSNRFGFIAEKSTSPSPAWDECANEAAERGRKTVEGTVFRDDPQAPNGDTS
jgi:hypothetical protein